MRHDVSNAAVLRILSRRAIFLALILAPLGASTRAGAEPIVYRATLTDRVAIRDSVSKDSLPGDTLPARFFSFGVAEGGCNVTITGTRLERDLDPAFWLFSGIYTDTSEFDGFMEGQIDRWDPGFIAFFDDETASPTGGPYGDPEFSGHLAAGLYTVIFVNGLSRSDDGGDGRFDYSLKVTANSGRLMGRAASIVPEPRAFVLSAIGLSGVIGLLSRARSRMIG